MLGSPVSDSSSNPYSVPDPDEVAEQAKPAPKVKPAAATQRADDLLPPSPTRQLSRLLAVCGWLVLTTNLLFLHYARPEQSDMYTKMRGRTVRSRWDYELLDSMLIILGVQAVVAGIGLLIVLRQPGRKGPLASFVIQLVAAAAGLAGVLYLQS